MVLNPGVSITVRLAKLTSLMSIDTVNISRIDRRSGPRVKTRRLVGRQMPFASTQSEVSGDRTCLVVKNETADALACARGACNHHNRRTFGIGTSDCID